MSKAKKQIITITESAANRIKDLIQKKQGEDIFGLKIGVSKRGCNGYTYTMNYCKSKADVARLDEVIEDKGVRVIVDSKAFMAVVGTQMDFIEDQIGSEFKFTNPNAAGMCGCGESFNLKEPALKSKEPALQEKLQNKTQSLFQVYQNQSDVSLSLRNLQEEPKNYHVGNAHEQIQEKFNESLFVSRLRFLRPMINNGSHQFKNTIQHPPKLRNYDHLKQIQQPPKNWKNFRSFTTTNFDKFHQPFDQDNQVKNDIEQFIQDNQQKYENKYALSIKPDEKPEPQEQPQERTLKEKLEKMHKKWDEISIKKPSTENYPLNDEQKFPTFEKLKPVPKTKTQLISILEKALTKVDEKLNPLSTLQKQQCLLARNQHLMYQFN